MTEHGKNTTLYAFTTDVREDLAWWLTLAPSLPWTFAKTMSDFPHSYVVRGRTLAEDDFMRAVRVIRTFGEPSKFFDRTGIYLVDPETNMKWWTMGDTLDGTIIINQAEADQVYGRQDAPSTKSEAWTVYDELAPIYDARYDTPDAHDEDRRVRSLIFGLLPPIAARTLDVGAGTGLLLDMGITAPSMITALDPSQAMLNELIRKHPTVKGIVAAKMEDRHDLLEPASYDLVVSLYGSPSYIPAETIRLMNAASRIATVLMHYVPGYAPDYESVDDIPTHTESREAAAALPGARTFTLNNFQVTVVQK